jgi:hypothetical protein
MSSLQHDPEKWVPVFRKDHAQIKIERDDDFEETSSGSGGTGIPFGTVMDQALNDWKLAVERSWSADAPDWSETARLVAAIAATGENPTLRLASMQAVPSLRNASARWPDRNAGEIAKRRLGIVLEVLNTLTAPRFGKRDGEVKPPTPDERCRQLLGLPSDRHLAATEIHRAFKRAAKTAHPDAGGSAQAFLELAAARDALMHPDGRKGG